MNRLEELRQKLENREGLSLEELQSLDAEVAEVFNAIIAGEIEGVDKTDLAVLQELKDVQQEVRSQGVTLQAQAAETEAAIAALAEVVNDGNETPATEETPAEGDDEKPAEGEEKPADGSEAPVETPEETPVVETPEETPAETPEETPVETPQAKAPLRALAAAASKAKVVAPIHTRSRSVGFVDANGNETNIKEFAQKMIERRERFGNTPRDVQELITMGTMKAEFSEYLSEGDSADTNSEKIEALIAGAMDSSNWEGNDPSNGLVASGGWCAPLDTVYGIETIAGTQRPVRDSLPRMGASRGGIRFRKGLSLAQATALGATGIWTNAIDQTPGSNTKSVGVVNCDNIVEVTTNAVYRQLKFGNFRGRADAEGVASWTGLTAADWARVAETQLLDGIVTNSSLVTTDAHGLGFARDFLNQVIRAGASYRSRNRMDRDARLRLMLPQWLPDAIIVDLMESVAAENEFFFNSAADITSMLNKQNFNVTYYSDTPTGAGQVYGAQGSHDLLGWKATADWFLFHEGAFVFLDSGTLDLGLVRDSTLNGKNDFEIFAENFENVAFTGVESMRIRSTVAVNGTAAAGIDNHSQSQS